MGRDILCPSARHCWKSIFINRNVSIKKVFSSFTSLPKIGEAEARKEKIPRRQRMKLRNL